MDKYWLREMCDARKLHKMKDFEINRVFCSMERTMLDGGTCTYVAVLFAVSTGLRQDGRGVHNWFVMMIEKWKSRNVTAEIRINGNHIKFT